MKNNKVVYKPYTQAQPSLLPPSLEELIPEDHLVRVVNRVVDALDIGPVEAKYVGGGTSSYHPRMMLKVLAYGYAQKIYTSRRIAKGLREDVNFMWLAGGNRPDFRTINRFRGEVLKGRVRAVFTGMLELLVEGGYVKLENYFVDGTKEGADANLHKVVWAKRTEKYKRRVQEQIGELLEEIERANAEEEAEYGEDDLEELGGKGGIDTERLKQKIAELNERLRNPTEKPPSKKALKRLEKDCLPRLEKYEQQEQTLAGRNSYSRTDPDASSMRMKEDRGAKRPWPRPAYNGLIGTEGQFISGYSLHQRVGDTACFIAHMEQQQWPQGREPDLVCGDAGFGSEENYAYLEQHRIGNYLKYNTFHQETHPPRRGERKLKASFRSEYFPYDPQEDRFTCPANQPLTYRETRSVRTDTGYLSERRYYECEHCTDCPLKPHCTQAKGNRRIQVSFKLREYRRQARENLLSEQGVALRQRRCIEPETVFGNIKQNLGFRRFHLRGFQKAETEWGLVCIAHNLRKLAAI